MGIAVIIPNVNFQDANLGKVTLQQGVPLRSMTIVGPDEVTEPTVFNVNFFPANTSQRGIVWSIVSGGIYASIDEDTGELTPIVGAVLNDVVIRATSAADSDIYAEKTVTVSYGMVYAEKTALVGDGVAYLHTNYYINPASKISIDYQIDNLPAATGTLQYRTIWGAFAGGSVPISRHLLQIKSPAATIFQYILFGAEVPASSTKGLSVTNGVGLPPIGARIKQEISIRGGFVSSIDEGDFVESFRSGFESPTHPVEIFGLHNSSAMLEMSLFAFKASEGDAVMLNLVPCTLLSDIDSSRAGDAQAHLAGENGMWDKIGKKFYGNVAESGSFSVID